MPPDYQSPPFAPMGAEDNDSITAPRVTTGATGPAGPAGPAGATGPTGPSGVPATFISVDMTDDQDFNGDGSGGAIELSPWTILQNDTNWDGDLIWDFKNTAIAAGWVVDLAVFNLPATPATLEIRFNNVHAFTLDSTNVPTTADFHTPISIFFNGVAWNLKANAIGTTT